MKANQQMVTVKPSDFFQEVIQHILGKRFRHGHHTVRAAGGGADGLREMQEMFTPAQMPALRELP
jgi:hypothetical protein